MNYSKEYLTELSNRTNFIRDNIEKVLRLSEVLKFLNESTIFKNNVVLKGGTAINLTTTNLLRLSVDIDLDIVNNIDKNEMITCKELYTRELVNYMNKEGYLLTSSNRDHYALISFSFDYINNSGNKDNIKVEINLMDRCHVLPLENIRIKPSLLFESFNVLVLNKHELYGSKINAVLSRTASRDLYDIYHMIKSNNIDDIDLLRKCVVFYNMIGGEQNIDAVDLSNLDKFNYRKYKMQLKPVISKKDDFDVEKAKQETKGYLERLLVLKDSEKEFVQKFRLKEYCPELLFDKKEIVNNIQHHPMALYRCGKR